MASPAYEALARSRLVQELETTFRQATGIWLKLVPPGTTPPPVACLSAGSAFCSLVSSLPDGRRRCDQAAVQLQQPLSASRAEQLSRCFAGLSLVAVPVLADGEQVATLLAGRVLPRKAARRDVARLAKLLGGWGANGQWPQARRAYLETPVVSREQFAAAARLLGLFAQRLGEYTAHCRLVNPQDPPCVARAKRYVQAHAFEPLRMRQVAQHVHLSPHYFCKLYKKTTGQTFTESLTQLRLEKAKTLLLDPFARVSEIAYAVGFGSLPHFNSVFRRRVGMSPTVYRRRLRHEFTI